MDEAVSKGLRVERQFTREGEDVYESVQWSRRDSRISNPDGSIVFEMKDAEVPEGWSQVAADIMVSKYFRKAGVPQLDERGNPTFDDDGKMLTGPEGSARQVIKRLAATWRSWGETSGYFASDRDADAFEDELAYMLLHQMAAPNSPQWFNTGLAHMYGIKGTPQGFWYVDPDTEELLPSPDSYTRPAPHACFPAGTTITTRDGIKAIEKIEIGDEVLTHNGRYRRVSDVMQRQVDESLVRLGITGRIAKALTATGNHPVLAVRAGMPTTATPEWVVAADIQPGDHVVAAGDPASGELPQAVDLVATTDRESFYGTVYNFQVEDDESYVANGIVVHNCFINSVDDDLVNEGGIMDLWVREARLFKMGSGTGSNFSKIRAEGEQLSGGGKSSGLMSFLKVGDRAAGAIKSGGTTRRAAKMVILDVDHPDIETFIRWKAEEEKKVRALVAAGYSSDFNGEAYATVSGQNSNNSVRLSNEFIDAVLNDQDWELTARTDGSVMKTVKARDLWRQVADAAWQCADPGVQFDTTIQEWHTSPAGGRINATNPCFTGETRIATDKGLIQFRDLVRRAAEGESFEVYSHDATHPDAPVESVSLSRPTQIMVTGTNEIVKLEFSDGRVIRTTPNHRLFTSNRGWVRADELTAEDRVRLLDRAVDFGMAAWSIPVSSEASSYQARSSRRYAVELPAKWSEDFAHYLGWLVGDGSMTGKMATTIYGSGEEQQTAMLAHAELLTAMNGGMAPKPTAMTNGTYQLRVSRGAIRKFLVALGVTQAKSAHKRVPCSIFEAPKPIVAAFLQGLFDADGTVVHRGDKSRYAGLGSTSEDLLRDVQQLLDTFGIRGRIYRTRAGGTAGFEYTTKLGEDRTYESIPMHDLRVTSTSLERFAAAIGFTLPSKRDRLEQLMVEATRYASKDWSTLVGRRFDGFETTYNLTEPINHSYVAGGALVSNCSEYVFLDNTACNLASLNLVTFYDAATGGYDLEAYRHAIRLWTIVLEISVTMAHFPSAAIAQGSYDYRTLGLGYANLGSLLMQMGIAYDSDEGRAIAGAMTAILTGHSYSTSAEMAGVVGPFPRYAENAESMLRVIRNHRRAALGKDDYEGVGHKVVAIDQQLCPADMLHEAHNAWNTALKLGETYGYRNAQTSVLAPTGCLVGGTLVPTERGLVRLASLGDVNGSQWQDLGLDVATDEGSRTATKFYVNGVEPVVTVETSRGYRIQGTPTHRIRVVTEAGDWTWKRFADINEGDIVPLQMNQLVGESQVVPLPPLPEAYWTSEHNAIVPRVMTADLAEFIGYFMGDGSLHSKGIRLAVSRDDFDVVERLTQLGKELFGLDAHRIEKGGYVEVAFHSVRLTLWWEACGLAKGAPSEGHSGKGYRPRVPDAVLHSNDPAIYQAFIRGLFEADGTVMVDAYPSWSTTSLEFSRDVQSLLLALGYPTTRKMDRTGWGDSDLAVLRLLNLSYNDRWAAEIGFMGHRKQASIATGDHPQTARMDHIPLTREMVDRLASANDTLRRTLLAALARHGMVTRRSAEQLMERTGDAQLGHLLRFFYDRAASAELGEEQYTFDLSVPDNVTYVANGFVSHNTIGLLMDCDTTGVEPDFALVKFKKLAGGGYFKIVNQSVTPALRRLGYTETQIEQIVDYVIGTMSLHRAPHINTASLIAKGFTGEDVDKIETLLPGVFELGFAFNQWTLGEATMQRLGFTPEQYNDPRFNMLKALGYTDAEIIEANDYVCGRQTIEGAPGLLDEHLSVFDCANRNGRYGQRFIHHTGHIRMMAAAQPFISGAISKTINMPNEVTIEDIEESYFMSWELGLKAMALYRDGSKASQPLSAKSDDAVSEEEPEELEEALAEEIELVTTGHSTIHGGMFQPGISPAQAYADLPRPRFLLPSRRSGYTQEARIGGHKVFLRTGEYDDGSLGELFIDLAKEGATLRGILSCFAIAVSKGLQYGVPLEEFVDTFTFQTFEPRGMVEGHPNIKMANSIVDYVFRALGVEYLHRDELAQVPPVRSDLPEPPKGLALEAGVQLDLTDSAMEDDIDAEVAAAGFVDHEDYEPPAIVDTDPSPALLAATSATAMSPSADVQTMSVQTALASNMGDAPLCDTCGHITVRNGSCYRCLNCGDSKGCS